MLTFSTLFGIIWICRIAAFRFETNEQHIFVVNLRLFYSDITYRLSGVIRSLALLEIFVFVDMVLVPRPKPFIAKDLIRNLNKSIP